MGERRNKVGNMKVTPSRYIGTLWGSIKRPYSSCVFNEQIAPTRNNINSHSCTNKYIIALSCCWLWMCM
jgi:hypothetical protein